MNTQRCLAFVLLAAGTVVPLGCGSSTPASFRHRDEVELLMDGVYLRDERETIGDAEATMIETIDEFYGTPSHLVAWERLSIDYGEDGEKLARGRQLYMEHCMHCHGVSGDGAGPTARYLDPPPRDYRLGLFKFTSTKTPAKPAREDLKRTVLRGIPGTYMPSFLLLEEDELDAIVEYVVWLSCRGDMEQQLAANLRAEYGEAVFEELSEEEQLERARQFEAFLASDDEFESFTALINIVGDTLANNWAKAETPEEVVVPSVPRPEPTPESIARGRKLFLNEAKCVNCHGPAGKGDGPQTLAFQELKEPQVGTRDVPGLFDDWGNPIEPRNLTRGQYRGGRRPIDVYRRIKAGIKGTPMPATAVPDEDIWHLVNYVMSIPYADGPSGADEEPAVPATAERTANDTTSGS